MTLSSLPIHPREERKPGFWIPYAIVGFFLTLIIIQIAFLIIATRSFSGLVTDEPYATGIDYNDIIAARQAEAELGWQISLRHHGDHISVHATDRLGEQLDGVRVHGSAELMGRAPQRLPLHFTQVAPDHWITQLDLPVPGRWYARVHVEQNGQAIARLIEFEARPQ